MQMCIRKFLLKDGPIAAVVVSVTSSYISYSANTQCRSITQPPDPRSVLPEQNHTVKYDKLITNRNLVTFSKFSNLSWHIIESKLHDTLQKHHTICLTLGESEPWAANPNCALG